MLRRDAVTLPGLVVSGWRIGVIAGFLELIVTAWPAVVAGWPPVLAYTPHRIWLKPVTAGVVCAVVGGLASAVVAVARGSKGVWPWDRAASWAVFAAALAICLFPFASAISAWSVLLLAAGGAVRLSDLAMRRPVFLRSSSVRWIAHGAIAITVLAALLILTRPLQRGSSSPDVAASTGPKPHVLLVVLDTVRSLDLHSASGASRLPHLARLAAEGASFSQAFATSSWTLESHASLFTGRYAPEVFSNGQTPINDHVPLPRDVPVIAEILRDAGYATGGFVANTLYASRYHGLDRGFDYYDDFAFQIADIPTSTTIGSRLLRKLGRGPEAFDEPGRRPAESVTGSFLRWVDRQSGRPFFAFLNLFDAHDPYLPPRRFRREPFPGNTSIDPLRRYEPPESEALERAYEDCLQYLDYAIGGLVQALRDRHLLDDTILIITSDHGEQFGEHGLMSHANSLYRQLTHVPLIVRFPTGIPARTVVESPVSLRDVPATLLDLSGTRRQTLPGTSLAAHWKGGSGTVSSPALSSIVIGAEPHRWALPHWPVSKGGMRSIASDGFYYIRTGDGTEQLFEFPGDPEQSRNLSALPDFTAVLGKLRLAATRGG